MHFKHFKRENFRNDIQSQLWNDLEGMENPNEMWIKWKAMFLEVCDKHAPIRTRRTRASKSPWINSDLKRTMYYRDRLKLKAIKSNLHQDRVNNKKTRNRVNTEIKNTKKRYYDGAFKRCANNPKKTWQTINEIMSRKKNNTVINEIECEGTTVHNPIPCLAEVFFPL